MSSETDSQTAMASNWPAAGLATLVALMAVSMLFYPTLASMVDIWMRSETFTHGFLILPISLWLVWERRHGLLRLTPRPEYRVLWLMIPLGFLWLLAWLVDVLVVQQLAYVAMLILVVWALLGNRVARYLMFPLGFLFFAVPMGEALIPPLMDFTADFTVNLLRLTGIPVYREGTFFSIPSGNWSVVEGCSGVRYLIASVTLGVLYAYLTYTRTWKRLLFALLSIVVPVIANGLRAYMIVMIAHLSDMRLALGIDHYIYGWVFFGIVIFIMFAIGAFWRDPPAPLPVPEASGKVRPASPWPALAAVLAVAALWPGLGLTLERKAPAGAVQAVLKAPAGQAGWRVLKDPPWDWRPQILNPDARLAQAYGRDGRTVGLYAGFYLSQRQGAELINSQNIMVRQKHPVWSNKGERHFSVDLGGRRIEVVRAKLESAGLNLAAWYWYRVGDRYTINPYWAKVMEAAARLFGLRKDGALLVVAAPYDEDPREAKPALRAFLKAMLPALEQALDRAAGRS